MVRIGDHATLQGAAGTSSQLAIYDGGERARSSVFGRDVSYLLALLGHDSRFSMLMPPEASQGGCTCWLLSDMTLIALASYCKADGSGALQIKHTQFAGVYRIPWFAHQVHHLSLIHVTGVVLFAHHSGAQLKHGQFFVVILLAIHVLSPVDWRS
jgi:hypothetical protein